MLASRREAIRWGAFAQAANLGCGYWMQPAKAAALMGVSSRQLAHWADMGLITVLHEPGHTRRYLEQELRLVAFLIRNVRYPNAALLKRILKHGFYVN